MICRLSLVISVSIGFLLSLSGVFALACPKPDEVTVPPPKPPELSVLDNKDRTVELYSNSYALIIGQSEYQHLPVLEDVIPEMRNLRAALEGNGFMTQVYYNLDSSALKSTIDCFIHSVQNVDPSARVVIYYAGHGATKKVRGVDVGYVLPTDAPTSTNDPSFFSKALGFNQFITWAKDLEVKHALFIFDSCFSGSVLTLRGGETPMVQPYSFIFSDAAQQPLRAFLTAGTASQEVPAQSQFSILITQALLGLRRDADSNRDGFLTGTELGGFLQTSVPLYVPNQTPMMGKILDSSLNLGEIVFKLPDIPQVIPPMSPVESQQTVLRPVFRGATGQNGMTIGQEYIIEEIVSSSLSNCDEGCDPKSKATAIELVISVPPTLPESAILSDPVLTCQGCSADFRVDSGPALHENNKTAKATISSWEKSAVWHFSAKILASGSTDKTALVINNKDNEALSVDLNHLSVIAAPGKQSRINDKKIDEVVVGLASDVTAVRREARFNLASLLDEDPSATSELIRSMPTGTYRYNIGVAEALAKTVSGWQTNESISRDILKKVQLNTKDSNLKSSLDKAIKNMRVSVYYEVGKDGWLTKAGQIKPFGQMKPKLPTYSELKKGDILESASEVYLRAGASRTSGSVGVLPPNECVKVVDQESEATTPDQIGGWLRVVRTPCKASGNSS